MAYAVIKDGVVINAVESEPDFAEEQGWIELPVSAGIGWLYVDGAFSPPPPPVAAVPSVVSRRQAKLALLAAGKLADAETAIAGADTETQINWNDAVEFRRDNALVATIGSALGLTSDQIDDLFRLAITL